MDSKPSFKQDYFPDFVTRLAVQYGEVAFDFHQFRWPFLPFLVGFKFSDEWNFVS